MAARDRFGVYAEPGASPLQRAIREFSVEINVAQMIHTETYLQEMPAILKTTNRTWP